MNNRRLLAFSASTAVSLSSLALPVAAQASDTHIPPLPLTATAGAKKACATATVDFRESVAQARASRAATLQRINSAYQQATTADLAALAAHLKAAHNPTARRAAIATFRSATADERQARAAARKAAKRQFLHSLAAAAKHRRGALATC